MRDGKEISMKSLFSRLINIIIYTGVTFAIVLSCSIVSSNISNAKTTTKKISMTVGQKKKCQVPGKTKKTVYKSSNRKIASVSKKGIITAKKKGKCTITVKASKRTCKYILTVRKKTEQQDSNTSTSVPVLPESTEQPYSVTQSPDVTSAPDKSDNPGKQINVKASMLASGKRLYTITNNNSVQISYVKLSMRYYNSDNVPIKSSEILVRYLAPLETRYVVVSNNVEDADYSKTETSITYNDSQNSKKVRVPVAVSAQVDSTDNTILVTMSNIESAGCEVKMVCLFKDDGDNIIDAREVNVSFDGQGTKTETIIAPYKITSYEPIEYSSYELIYYAIANK